MLPHRRIFRHKQVYPECGLHAFHSWAQSSSETTYCARFGCCCEPGTTRPESMIQMIAPLRPDSSIICSSCLLPGLAPAGAHPGLAVVDALPARVVPARVALRHPPAVRRHGEPLQRRRRQRPRRPRHQPHERTRQQRHRIGRKQLRRRITGKNIISFPAYITLCTAVTARYSSAEDFPISELGNLNSMK